MTVYYLTVFSESCWFSWGRWLLVGLCKCSCHVIPDRAGPSPLGVCGPSGPSGRHAPSSHPRLKAFAASCHSHFSHTQNRCHRNLSVRNLEAARITYRQRKKMIRENGAGSRRVTQGPFCLPRLDQVQSGCKFTLSGLNQAGSLEPSVVRTKLEERSHVPVLGIVFVSCCCFMARPTAKNANDGISQT